MKMVVGISGGVDSAVAALLLREQGHDVTGVFMKNWEEDDTEEYCSAAEDLKVAQAVCATIGIELKTVNFASEYWDRVFQYFLAEYQAGRTPNPDVLCNKEIKFKAFLEYALSLGAEKIATGHYARTAIREGSHRLLKAVDDNKDQTYFLHLLGQRELAHSVFPVGDFPKHDVRVLAQKHGLPNFDRKDSTGICFIGERRFKDFLSRFLPAQPGDIKTPEGISVGRHTGVMYHTIGQRQGLGIGGPGEAWYVVGKDTVRNVLYVAQGESHPALFCDALDAERVHWISQKPNDAETLTAKIRYRQTEQTCSVNPGGAVLRATFDAPQRAVTPGQSIVFYRGNECLGGGVITRAVHNTKSRTDSNIGRVAKT
jgi:tRNA-specific 2-thiouridylase